MVGDAGDAGQAQRRAEELRPDLILLDNHLPGVNGVDAVPALKAALPDVRIILLTVSEDEMTSPRRCVRGQRLSAEDDGCRRTSLHPSCG